MSQIIKNKKIVFVVFAIIVACLYAFGTSKSMTIQANDTIGFSLIDENYTAPYGAKILYKIDSYNSDGSANIILRNIGWSTDSSKLNRWMGDERIYVDGKEYGINYYDKSKYFTYAVQDYRMKVSYGKHIIKVENINVLSGAVVGASGQFTIDVPAPKYDVVYKGNGGTWNGTDTWSNKATYGENYVTEKNFYDNPGYEFVGWNTDPNGTGTDWTSWIGKPWKWTYHHGVTLYAQWEAQSYTIAYNGNGATSGSMKDQPMVYDKAANLYKNTYKKDNADFIGWNLRSDGKGTNYKDQQSVKNLTTEKNGVVTMYAKWDHVPVMKTLNDAYFKDEVVTIQQIINKNASANDEEDGTITNKIKVEKIVYPDGTVVNNPSPSSKLDTSRGTNPNNPIKVSYTVTDSYGHIVNKTGAIEIINPQSGEELNPPTEPGHKPKLYNRYIDKEYEWSLDSDSVWEQDPEYRDALNDVLNSLE